GRLETVIDRLLDSHPSVRWQVMRDLTRGPARAGRGRAQRGARPRPSARGCSRSRRTMVGGVARHGTVAGTLQSTSSCCCEILRATKHAGRWASFATGDVAGMEKV